MLDREGCDQDPDSCWGKQDGQQHPTFQPFWVLDSLTMSRKTSATQSKSTMPHTTANMLIKHAS